MKESDFQVIFRLPGSEQLDYLEESEGNDAFILSAFLRHDKQFKISGKIQNISKEDASSKLAKWSSESTIIPTDTTEENYQSIVNKAVEAIKENRFQKVVLAGRKWMSHTFTLKDLFTSLIEHYPKAFVYVLKMEERIMIGASPETLLTSKETELFTEALGGTKTRGSYSDKEWLEHEQIKQYISGMLQENTFEFFVEETVSKVAANLEHLCTGFKIKSKGKLEDILLANILHPTAAICGLPYEESLAFILENEGFDRNYYSGYLGPIKDNGDFQFYVNLRCADWYNNGLCLYAGAGINLQSKPDDEWLEINTKMQTIAQWVK